MRYLLHSAEATYNAITKKFVYSLDRRIQDPTSIKLTKASFVASTADNYPPVVYVRSDGLSRLCKSKHTVALKGNSHEDGTNIIAVLEERHTAGKYSLEEKPRTLPVKKHENVTVIDVYFTDGDVILNGEYTPTEVAGTTDADMAVHVFNSDIRVWLDFKKEDAVLNTALSQATVGQSINRIISHVPGGDLQLMASGVDKVQYTTFGDNMFGCKQQIGAAWAYSIDGSGGGYDFESGSHIFCLRSPPRCHRAGGDLAIQHVAFVLLERHIAVQSRFSGGIC